MHIDGMTELLKDKKVFKEMEEKQKYEQFKENFGIQDNPQSQKNDKQDSTNNNNKETDL